jgi:hypothetical protein
MYPSGNHLEEQTEGHPIHHPEDHPEDHSESLSSEGLLELLDPIDQSEEAELVELDRPEHHPEELLQFDPNRRQPDNPELDHPHTPLSHPMDLLAYPLEVEAKPSRHEVATWAQYQISSHALRHVRVCVVRILQIPLSYLGQFLLETIASEVTLVDPPSA